jgi:hypothetical protein
MSIDDDLLINGTSTVLLLSDELIDEEDDDVYMAEGDEEEEFEEVAVDYEAIAGTELDMIDSSFDYLDQESLAAELVEENPFEPVYPAQAGLLFAVDGEDENSPSEENFEGGEKVQGRVLEAVSLDNILPEGSRRRRAC